MIDFPDMLEKFLDSGEAPRLRVMFVDEAQDLSLIQWRLVKKIEEKSQDSYISGDDDQAIYKWNGAHVNTFINLEGERTVLQQSQRVPQKPFALANKLIKRVTNRVEKEWLPKLSQNNVEKQKKQFNLSNDKKTTTKNRALNTVKSEGLKNMLDNL